MRERNQLGNVLQEIITEITENSKIKQDLNVQIQGQGDPNRRNPRKSTQRHIVRLPEN